MLKKIIKKKSPVLGSVSFIHGVLTKHKNQCLCVRNKNRFGDYSMTESDKRKKKILETVHTETVFN